MIEIKQFTNRLKFVNRNDIKSIFPMIVGYFQSLVFRINHNNIWLICERENEARDNGYWFYKYMCEKHPEIESVYAINKNSVDYAKVKLLGNVIQYGSVEHWKYYFSAKRNISSQKQGKPNAALCYIIEVYLGARKNRVYLRHGISKDKQRWVYYDVSKINLFITSARREYEYVLEHFGYPKENVKLLGLCRYDNLLSEHVIKRQILIMPTMREWLANPSSTTLKYEKSLEFKESEFFKSWTELLNDNELIEIADVFKVKIVFYLHSALQKYSNDFVSNNSNVVIAKSSEYDVQELLMESSALITDYSSIYFDFAYMKKPLIYYQFDYEKYRSGQYQEGYFSYLDDGFGPVCTNKLELIREIKKIIDNNMKTEEKYLERTKSFFEYNDTNNCERTYNAIKLMKK